MKRILLLAAGALGTAGMIALAAPASADEPATQQSQLETFKESIDPETVVNEFLYGNCTPYPDKCPAPPIETNPGVLHQFDYFRQNLQGQSKTFGESIDPQKQREKFVKSVTAPPSPPSSDEDK